MLCLFSPDASHHTTHLAEAERQTSKGLAQEWRVSLGIPVRARSVIRSARLFLDRSGTDRPAAAAAAGAIASRSWVKFSTDGLTISGARDGGRMNEKGGGGEIDFFLSRNDICLFFCLFGLFFTLRHAPRSHVYR